MGRVGRRSRQSTLPRSSASSTKAQTPLSLTPHRMIPQCKARRSPRPIALTRSPSLLLAGLGEVELQKRTGAPPLRLHLALSSPSPPPTQKKSVVAPCHAPPTQPLRHISASTHQRSTNEGELLHPRKMLRMAASGVVSPRQMDDAWGGWSS